MTARGGRRVLVTGGGGFLGNAIVRRLVKRGDRVSSFSRRAYPALEAVGVTQIRGDIGDPGSVQKACRGMEIVFHTAAKPPPWGSRRDYHRTNVTGTRNVIAACLRQGVRALVHTSTPSVVFDGTDMENADESVPYPAAFNACYPRTKAAAEQSVVEAAGKGLPAVALRPHQIWGPGDPHFVPRILARARRLRQIGDGRNLVDTTYIDNAADAHLLAADRLCADPSLAGRVYFISQGEPVPAWRMINDILAAAGKPPVTGRISHRTAWLAGGLLELLYRLLPLPGEPPMTRFLADAVARSHWFDIGAARRDLGYVPAVTTREGLARLSAWLRDSRSGRVGS